MKKIAVYLVIFLFLILIYPRFAFGGAWTIPKNNVWAQYYMKGLWSRYTFGGTDEQTLRRHNNGGKSYGMSIIPEVHYGVTDWLEPFSLFEYKESTYKEYERIPSNGPYRRKANSVTSVDAGCKIRLLKEPTIPFILSTQLRTSFYTGKGQDTEPQLSDGNDSFELRFLAGKFIDLKPWPIYLGLESGYRFKNRNVTNDVPIFGEVGVWPFKWLLVKSEIDGYWAHDNTGDLEKSYAIWRIGPVFQLLNLWTAIRGADTGETFANEVTRKGKSFNLEVQYGRTFWGRNTSSDHEIVAKVYTQF